MDGKITIDGYVKNKQMELITHGEAPDPGALCSFVYKIDKSAEALELMDAMKNSLQNALQAEHEATQRQYFRECLQGCLRNAGINPLPDKVLNCIVDEFMFQIAALE